MNVKIFKHIDGHRVSRTAIIFHSRSYHNQNLKQINLQNFAARRMDATFRFRIRFATKLKLRDLREQPMRPRVYS